MASILIVDDSKAFRQLIRKILSNHGYDCQMAADAAQAREMLQTHPVDLILCDIHMPGESGLAFTRSVHRDFPETATVMVTGDKSPLMVDSALEQGIYDYVTKPIDRDRLLISIANALHRSELEHQNRRHQHRLEAEIMYHTRALRKSEARFRSLFDNSKDIIFFVSKSGRLLKINASGIELLGFEPKSIEGLHCADFLTKPSDFDRLRRELERNGFVKDFSLEIRNRSGGIVPVVMTLTVRLDSKGRILEYQGILRDVTKVKESRKRLKASEAKYRELVQNANSIILKLDTTGCITFINEFAQQFFGYAEEELINRPVIGTITPAVGSDGRDLNALIRKIVSNPETVSKSENENVLRNGDRVWISWTNKPILSEQGEVVGVLSIGQDITQRKEALEALRGNYAFLQQLIDSVPGPIYYKDTDGVFRIINRAFKKLVRLPSEQILGKTVYHFAPPDRADLYSRADEEVMRTLGQLTLESRIEYPDRGERHVVINKAVITDSKGKPTGIVGVMADITERKLAEKENLLLAAAISQADEMVMITDAAGLIQYVNPAFEKQTGYSRTEVVGYSPRLLKSGKQDAEFYAAMWNEILQGRVWAGRLTNRRKDGSLYEEEARISPIRDQAGRIINFVGVKRDITRQVQLERQLSQAQRIEAIGTLAGGIAHEINTPIQYVLYNTGFLKETFGELNTFLEQSRKAVAAAGEPAAVNLLLTDLGKTADEIDLDFILKEIPPAIEQTLEGAGRVAEIVRAMKEFSHPGTEEKTPVDINKSIESTVTVARNEWKYVADLQTDLDPDLPLIPCLPGELNQVILNLVVNAAHAIADVVGEGSDQKGRITIQTRRNDGWVHIRVTDTGNGIPETIRDRIFDPFFTTKEVGRGTGQGLAICHNVVVEKHGGRIEVETESGKGTEFLVQLPLESKTGCTQ